MIKDRIIRYLFWLLITSVVFGAVIYNNSMYYSYELQIRKVCIEKGGTPVNMQDHVTCIYGKAIL